VKPLERKQILKWFKTLKFLDHYMANIKQAVHIGTDKLNRLKSHDCHIMMERLVPVILCVYFNANLWKMLAGHSYFYKQISAKEVLKAMV
jgi:predicted ATP-dependent Lon-type protease